MATLQQKFPQFSDALQSVLVYPVAVSFKAQLAGGIFSFPKLREFAFKGNSGEVLVMDGATIAANIDQLIFSQSLLTEYNKGFFSLDIIKAGNNSPVMLAPFQFSAFNQGGEFSANWRPSATKNNEEEFYFQLDGALLQTAQLVALGINFVTIQVTANIYRIKTRAAQ